MGNHPWGFKQQNRAGLAAMMVPVHAHHSLAMYDGTKTLVITDDQNYGHVIVNAADRWPRMLWTAFGDAPADKYKRASDERGGAYSILIGVAANRCFETGNAVRIIAISDAPIADWRDVRLLPSGTVGEITVARSTCAS